MIIGTALPFVGQISIPKKGFPETPWHGVYRCPRLANAQLRLRTSVAQSYNVSHTNPVSQRYRMELSSAGPLLTRGLYVVGTPIGNMEDISFRAVRTLGAVQRIYAEDTRNAGRLLSAYALKTPLVSCHSRNEISRASEVVDAIMQGMAIAVVSDAGTPGISDPGGLVIKAAVEAKLPVHIIPGPCAVTTGLLASGLDPSKFSFLGFLPAKGGPRRRVLETAAASDVSVVVYVAARNLLRVLAECEEIGGPLWRCCVAQDLTKPGEAIFRGAVSDAAQHFSLKGEVRGEITLVLSTTTSIKSSDKANDTTATLQSADVASSSDTWKELPAAQELLGGRGISEESVPRGSILGGQASEENIPGENIPARSVPAEASPMEKAVDGNIAVGIVPEGKISRGDLLGGGAKGGTVSGVHAYAHSGRPYPPFQTQHQVTKRGGGARRSRVLVAKAHTGTEFASSSYSRLAQQPLNGTEDSSGTRTAAAPSGTMRSTASVDDTFYGTAFGAVPSNTSAAAISPPRAQHSGPDPPAMPGKVDSQYTPPSPPNLPQRTQRSNPSNSPYHQCGTSPILASHLVPSLLSSPSQSLYESICGGSYDSVSDATVEMEDYCVATWQAAPRLPLSMPAQIDCSGCPVGVPVSDCILQAIESARQVASEAHRSGSSSPGREVQQVQEFVTCDANFLEGCTASIVPSQGAADGIDAGLNPEMGLLDDEADDRSENDGEGIGGVHLRYASTEGQSRALSGDSATRARAHAGSSAAVPASSPQRSEQLHASQTRGKAGVVISGAVTSSGSEDFAEAVAAAVGQVDIAWAAKAGQFDFDHVVGVMPAGGGRQEVVRRGEEGGDGRLGRQ